MTAIRGSSRHNQIGAVIALTVVVLMVNRGSCARPSEDSGAFSLRHDDVSPLLDKLMRMNANEDVLYSELKKYHHQQPNYLTKWPGLRDLLLTATDYDDNVNNIEGSNDETLNLRLEERLRQLAAASNVADLEDVREDSGSEMAAELSIPTPMPQKKASTTFKDHGTKKNVQYMSPCHFKICNMGRKRNVRYLTEY